jgi:hypothetical protein
MRRAINKCGYHLKNLEPAPYWSACIANESTKVVVLEEETERLWQLQEETDVRKKDRAARFFSEKTLGDARGISFTVCKGYTKAFFAVANVFNINSKVRKKYI